MVYNELEQEDTLSCVRVRLATIAYLDILLGSIWAIHKIRQSPISYKVGNQRYEKEPDDHDMRVLEKIEGLEWPVEIPITELP
jgi:hypothetical protein